jgi:hypothetical protein
MVRMIIPMLPVLLQAQIQMGMAYISLEEGLPYYGGVQLALNNEDGTYPMANGAGFYEYQRTFDLNEMSLSDWENLAVVVHGRNVNGSYDASLPVACGQVNNLNSNSNHNRYGRGRSPGHLLLLNFNHSNIY